MEVIVVLAGIGNIAWGFHNWQIRQRLDSLIAKATVNVTTSRKLFENAQLATQAATIEREHKVCAVCGRIVTQHATTEGVTTCVNCLANHSAVMAN